MVDELFVPQRSTEEYWATEEDSQIFTGHLHKRIREYWHVLKRTALWTRIYRNWKYYHSLFFDSGPSTHAIRLLGEQGEYAALSVNHFRNILQHLLNLATENRPSFDCRAVNTEWQSLQSARLGNALVDYYLQQHGVEEIYARALEDALVYSAGYVLTEWDTSKGKEKAANVETRQIYYEGDLSWSAPQFTDVFYDPTVKEWDELSWVIVRQWVNKWDLAARYPDKEEDIIAEQVDENEAYAFTFEKEREYFDDVIPIFKFWHKRCDAIPQGRMAIVAGKSELLEDYPMMYRELPVDRVVAGRYLNTIFGYSPGFDLQGIQEAYNSEISTILTNHKAFGVQSIWVPTGSGVSIEQTKEGLTFVETDTKPEALNLTDTPAEIFQILPILNQNMEQTSGVNSVARGQPEASLKSGRALAMIAAKAVQHAAPLMRSLTHLEERNMSKALWILKDFALEERIVPIVGKHNLTFTQAFVGADLEPIDRVIIQQGNSYQKTMAGRVDMADKLLEQGMLRNREEYFQVLQVGNLEPALEAENAQLALVREENEQLMQGGVHRALMTDNHTMHIKEHSALLNSTHTRANSMFASSVMAACIEHITYLMDPGTQLMMATLGYMSPLPAMPGAGPPGATPQAEQGEPGRPGNIQSGAPEETQAAEEAIASATAP